MEVISFFWSYNLKLLFEEKIGHWLHFQLDEKRVAISPAGCQLLNGMLHRHCAIFFLLEAKLSL